MEEDEQRMSKFNIGIATMIRLDTILNELIDAKLQRPNKYAYERIKELLGSLYDELHTEMTPEEIEKFEKIEGLIENYISNLNSNVRININVLNKNIRQAEFLLRFVMKRKGLIMPEKKDVDDFFDEY